MLGIRLENDWTMIAKRGMSQEVDNEKQEGAKEPESRSWMKVKRETKKSEAKRTQEKKEIKDEDEAPAEAFSETPEEYERKKQRRKLQHERKSILERINPLNIFSRKKDKETSDKTKTQSESRSTQFSLRRGEPPRPEEGVLTHVPADKSRILNILQNECDIYPDVVFQLFPDPRTEDILAESEELTGTEIHWDDEVTSATVQKIAKDEEPDALSSDEQTKLSADETKVIDAGTEGNDSIALAKVKTTKLMVKESDVAEQRAAIARGEKPKPLSPTLRRAIQTSGLTAMLKDQTENEKRDLSSFSPFKTADILTPEQVSELYEIEKVKPKRKSAGMLMKNAELYQTPDASTAHPVWSVSPDTVYEVVQLLKQHGFKSDQPRNIWPYNEFQAVDAQENTQSVQTDNTGSTEEGVATPTTDALQKTSGLSPTPDKFNDFFLLFVRFPEILTMELNDIRRKIHQLETFQIADMRTLILRDPRVLRRPAHHVRHLLETLDNYSVTNFQQIVDAAPHFLASTSTKELLRRLKFIDVIYTYTYMYMYIYIFF
ncbi:hypothetical protein RFI_23027 [Reticulomyxa filosa]|uniref:Uncharacterized protein n=1 Tax=Reticulomyxa filosa TaxID=46433 RepID=X6MK05_RETFI|nr:hypothetical protein RFI_23027 [Reticulomyxa filosa]|eukprot:ETO14343.1 hypothetical protein RFI_23027 [Reticulomyxa filosa]